LASEALAADQSWVSLKALQKNILSLDLKTESESALIIVSGNEFQTVGTEQQKSRLAKSVLVNGLSSSGSSDERSVRSLTRALMWRLRYVGAVAVLWLLKVNTATLYWILCWMVNQCSSRSNGWTCDCLAAWRTILPALFCTRCRTWMLLTRSLYSTELSSPVWSVWVETASQYHHEFCRQQTACSNK